MTDLYLKTTRLFYEKEIQVVEEKKTGIDKEEMVLRFEKVYLPKGILAKKATKNHFGFVCQDFKLRESPTQSVYLINKKQICQDHHDIGLLNFCERKLQPNSNNPSIYKSTNPQMRSSIIYVGRKWTKRCLINWKKIVPVLRNNKIRHRGIQRKDIDHKLHQDTQTRKSPQKALDFLLAFLCVQYDCSSDFMHFLFSKLNQHQKI